MALSKKDQAAVAAAAKAGGLKDVKVSSSGNVSASNSATKTGVNPQTNVPVNTPAPAPTPQNNITINGSGQYFDPSGNPIDNTQAQDFLNKGGQVSYDASKTAVVAPVTPEVTDTPATDIPAPTVPTPAATTGTGDTTVFDVSALPTITTNLAKGSTGTEVAALQQYLLGLGYSIPSLQNGSAKPGTYGNETMAAVTQWQHDQEAKGNLKVPDVSQYGSFGPLSRQAMAASGSATQETNVQGTPGTETDTGTGLGSAIDAEVAALRAAYGLDPADPTKSAVQQAIDDYQEIYKSLGVPDIKKSYTDAVNEFSDIQEELAGKIREVRDDPWLSQGVADARVNRLNAKYEDKLKIATAKMQLFDSLTKEGIAQANDIVSRVHQIQSDTAAVVNQAIDIVQKKEDALHTLKTEVVEVGGRKLLINSDTGDTVRDLGVSKVPGSGSGGSGRTGTAAERAQQELADYGSTFVPGATLSSGDAVIDDNGYITPSAWKEAIASYSGSRADFIKQFGYLLYNDGKSIPSSYGLTAVEQKIITGS